MNFMARSKISCMPVMAIIFILQGCGDNNWVSGIYENEISTLTFKNDRTFTFRLYNREYDGSYTIEGEKIIAKETKKGRLSTIVKNSQANDILCLSEDSPNDFYEARMCWKKK
jgi:hypothetical protein